MPLSLSQTNMITGSIVAIVTPMHADGSLDYEGLRKLVDWHVAEGTNAIVIVGTTGESPTVNVDEHVELIRVCVEQANKRITVIAGAGGNSTAEAIALATAAKKVGADAQLSVVPYYNKPPQEGLYRHFRTIAESVDLPMILYNVPGRTVADLSNDTVARLAQVPGIIGIKDATGNIERGSLLLSMVPETFAVYSGDDLTAIALMLLGGKGNISVTANVVPRAMSDLCKAAMAGDAATAWSIQKRLLKLHKQMFVEANPIPVKWALQQMGRIGAGIRLPLVPLSEGAQPALRTAMRDVGLL
jgi:4-hydroxy-tetrahydrodipicolinate synthase